MQFVISRFILIGSGLGSEALRITGSCGIGFGAGLDRRMHLQMVGVWGQVYSG